MPSMLNDNLTGLGRSVTKLFLVLHGHTSLTDFTWVTDLGDSSYFMGFPGFWNKLKVCFKVQL